HLESDSPSPGNRPRVTISGTRYKRPIAAPNGSRPGRGHDPCISEPRSSEVAVPPSGTAALIPPRSMHQPSLLGFVAPAGARSACIPSEYFGTVAIPLALSNP